MAWNESLTLGKKAERFAEDYFKSQGLNFQDVRDVVEYRKQDIDYIVDGLGTVEVKMNFQEALRGKEGKFFWMELRIGNRPGWWNFSLADYFLFFSQHGEGLLIKNDSIFKDFVEGLVETGDHSNFGLNRYDYTQDVWFEEFQVRAENMRIYFEQLKQSDVDYRRIVKRKRVY